MSNPKVVIRVAKSSDPTGISTNNSQKIYSLFSKDDDKSYNGFLDTGKTFINVHSNGKHEWRIPIYLRIGCAIDVRDFPFDTQECDFRFGSFTYSILTLDLNPENDTANLSSYTGDIFVHIWRQKGIVRLH